jgi:Cd(II)/Pb(II)-responsive transcriptional regulator
MVVVMCMAFPVRVLMVMIMVVLGCVFGGHVNNVDSVATTESSGICYAPSWREGKHRMKIGELAKATGTQAETIRYYEREGLIPLTSRTEGNYRVYDKSHVERLGFIRHCRCLDMTLDEIRVLLRYKDAPQENCHEVNQVVDDHIEHVTSRIRELKALERDLRVLRSQCSVEQSAQDCGVLGGLERAAREHDHAGKGAHQHLAGAHRDVAAHDKPNTTRR